MLKMVKNMLFKRPLLGVCALLLAGGLACQVSAGGPTPPASPIPFSTEAAGELQNLWQSTLAAAKNGQVSVTVTEQQLTSLMVLRLQEAQQTQGDATIRDVQVFLRGGKIQMFGVIEASNITANTLVVVSVGVTAGGQMTFSVDSADFGPIPAPASLTQAISDTLNEALTGQVGTLASGVKITSVLIADGQMTISAIFTRP